MLLMYIEKSVGPRMEPENVSLFWITVKQGSDTSFKQFILYNINLFHASGLFLQPLKTSEIFCFSDASRRFR